MPVVIDADWNLIRELYTQGLKPSQIELQTGIKAGTIASRASRCKWSSIASKAKELLQVVATPTQAIPQIQEETVSKASVRVRNSLAASLEHLAHHLDVEKPKSLKEAARLQQSLEATVRNAKVVMGWGDDTRTPVINIALMQQNIVEPAQPKETIFISQGDVLDVTP